MKSFTSKLAISATVLGALSGAPAALANTPFIGEVAWVPYNFAPRGWASCDGQILPINQHPALFSLLGTTYGGDGRTTFALPDVRSRTMLHVGQGPGLTDRRLGERGGAETHTLTPAEIPAHSHSLNASSGRATSSSPTGNSLANTGRSPTYADTPDVAIYAGSVGNTGGNQAHNNMQPYTVLHCIIALQGIFPSRN